MPASDLRDRPTLSSAKIVERLKAHAAEFQQLGVRRLWIFGSRARGDYRSDSDLDVLADVNSTGAGWRAMADLQAMLEDLTGLEVSLHLARSIPHAFYARIESDLTPVL